MTREDRLREMVGADGFEEASDQGLNLPMIITADSDGEPRIQTPWPAYRTDAEEARRTTARDTEAAHLAAARRRAVRG